MDTQTILLLGLGAVMLYQLTNDFETFSRGKKVTSSSRTEHMSGSTRKPQQDKEHMNQPAAVTAKSQPRWVTQQMLPQLDEQQRARSVRPDQKSSF